MILANLPESAPSLPIRADLIDLQAEMVAVFVAVEDAIRADRNLSRRKRNLAPHAALAHALRIADAHYGWLAKDAAVPACNAILNVHRRARRALGLNTLVHRLPAPCPSCDMRTLIRVDGDDVVRCRACHTSWAESEYRLLVRVLVEENRRRK